MANEMQLSAQTSGFSNPSKASSPPGPLQEVFSFIQQPRLDSSRDHLSLFPLIVKESIALLTKRHGKHTRERLGRVRMDCIDGLNGQHPFWFLGSDHGAPAQPRLVAEAWYLG